MASRGVSQSRGISDPALDALAHPGGDRLELAYEKCRDENVTLVDGVAPAALRFARYLRRAHRVCPKELWQTQIVALGSVPGINTYGPARWAARSSRRPSCRATGSAT
jgi:hypothetical protein